MIEMVMGIVAARIMPDPLIVGMNVAGVGISGFIRESFAGEFGARDG
jgi:hypothetical protein